MNKEEIVLLASISLLVIFGSFIIIYDANHQNTYTPSIPSKPITTENTINFYICLHNEQEVVRQFNFNEPTKNDKYRCWS